MSGFVDSDSFLHVTFLEIIRLINYVTIVGLSEYGRIGKQIWNMTICGLLT